MRGNQPNSKQLSCFRDRIIWRVSLKSMGKLKTGKKNLGNLISLGGGATEKRGMKLAYIIFLNYSAMESLSLFTRNWHVTGSTDGPAISTYEYSTVEDNNSLKTH